MKANQMNSKYTSSLLSLKGLAAMAALCASVSAFSQQPLSKEAQQDIQRHRAMASAHEAAAKCLESGKNHDICEKELQAACKGLAVGKYCGMKHVH